ncbi:MAG: ABC transporter ATP-binding protein/permease [Pseudomonadales bacterium]|nr:ABC transporter ATP-binding protein/permease [Pseudomonadales bacterium]
MTTTNEPTSVLKEVLGKNQFDDRVDTQSDIKTTEALRLIGRCAKLLTEAKWLFSLKFLLQLGLVFPALLLPWMAKILIDNVILQRPFGETGVAYPPFMNPILNLIDGLDPMGIMLTLTVIYVAMLFTIGSRMGGTGAGLLQGQDAATQAENTVSAGYSAGGGIWGIAEFMVHVRLTQSIANRVRTRLFHRLTHLPMTVLDDQRIGDSVFRVLYDVPEAPDLAYRVTLTPFFMGLGALISLYILQYSYGAVAPELIWIAWFAVPAAFVTTFPFAGALRRTNQNKRAAGSAATNAMEESITQVGAVQSLGASTQVSSRFASFSDQTFLRERYAIAVIIFVASIAGGVFAAAAIYVTILVSDQIIENTMTPGDFAVLLGIYYQISGAAGYYGAIWIKLQETLAAVRRVFFFLDYRSEENRSEGQQLDNIQESVVLEDVSFDYPDGKRALDRINVELPINKLVAIVGPTGAGKTTLAYLIPSLLTPTSGRILIDGIDIRELNVDSLRRHVTYVFQEHLLLSDTVRENLLLANPDATESKLHEALETAGCNEFLEKLPDGIDTVLGRSGDTLSVGQQQRLSIARGLVRDAKILILDEPTAALDPQTEQRLVGALENAAKDRLVIVIAHRLSTIRHADQIIFLEDGRIVESGTEAELMARPDGPYRTFVELQQT